MQLRAPDEHTHSSTASGTSPQHSTEIPLPLQEPLLHTGKRPGLAAQWVQNPTDGCHLDGAGRGAEDFDAACLPRGPSTAQAETEGPLKALGLQTDLKTQITQRAPSQMPKLGI